jgi:hypothetical protein
LKLREIEPRELDEEDIETKCEYIIAESGDKRRFKGNMRHQPSVREEPVRQAPPRQPALREPDSMRVDSVRAKPEDDYKCEYIIAEKTSKKYLIEESVDLRENEDAEVITCCRKNSRTH